VIMINEKEVAGIKTEGTSGEVINMPQLIMIIFLFTVNLFINKLFQAKLVTRNSNSKFVMTRGLLIPCAQRLGIMINEKKSKVTFEGNQRFQPIVLTRGVII